MVILENIDIDIDIDKAILQNIDIAKISNWFKFGISNRATEGGAVQRYLGIAHIESTHLKKGLPFESLLCKGVYVLYNIYIQRKS